MEQIFWNKVSIFNGKKTRSVNTTNHRLDRGSYMNAHVLLNLLNEFGKKIRREALPSILSVPPPPSLINPIIQDHECKILFIIWH